MNKLNLYLLTTGLGDFHVVDTDPTSAQKKLENLLDEADYGYSGKRKVSNIQFLAEELKNDHTGEPKFYGDTSLIIFPESCSKKKINLIGNMRHGKDTVAEMINKHTGLTFQSSSMAAAEIFIYDELKEKYGYTSFEECFEDRMNHRAEWHELIKEYNSEDKAKLAKEILKKSDMYVGMRSDVEVQECMKQGIFDYVIGVFDPRKDLEPKDSFDIDMWSLCDYVIMNNSDLETLDERVQNFCKILK